MIYIPFIYFLSLLIINCYRTKTFNLGSFLLLLYAFSALLSVFLYSVDFLKYHDIEIRLSSVIFYCVTLTIFFLPFMSGSQSKCYRVLLPDKKLFYGISLFFIVINCLAILLLLKAMLVVLSIDPKTLREAGLYNVYSVNALEAIGMWILGHFSDFYVLLLVFFFYSRTYLKNPAWFNIMLLVASMSTIVNGLMSGGRTQTIYWILVFISCFLYFKGDMPKRVRKKVVLFSVALFSILTVYLVSVTMMRFSGSFSGATDYDEAFSLLDYAGQIFLNFNDFFANFEHKGYTLARIFPFMYDWLHATNFDLGVYKRSIQMDIGVFSTFLGDWYIDMGITGIVLYTIFYSAAAFFIRRNSLQNSLKFQQILLFFLIFQLPLNGLFYYSLYNKTAMISVIGTIVIAVLFRFSEEDVIEVAAREAA